MQKLSKKEQSFLKKLSSPSKIQDYLNTLPFNFEKKGETYMSPRRVLMQKKAHCFEGALLASLALWLQGSEPLILDLKTTPDDQDHVVALYKKNGYWGAVSKTNHAVLRFRDPIYKNIRELALSYFHEYFLNKNGKKTLISYSKPFNLKKFGTSWLTDEKELWHLVEALDNSPHFPIVPKINKKFIRKADKIERKAGSVTEWKN
ncbi:MAG: hypothetical protein WCV55_00715 [Candidatus Paceibacterota bacterium]